MNLTNLFFFEKKKWFTIKSIVIFSWNEHESDSAVKENVGQSEQRQVRNLRGKIFFSIHNTVNNVK